MKSFIKKIIIAFIFFSSITTVSNAQTDAQQLLGKFAAACRQVTNASYQLTYSSKPLLSKDTLKHTTLVTFELLPSDTIVGYKLKLFHNNQYKTYNGSELFITDSTGSKARLISMMNEKNFRELTDNQLTGIHLFGKDNLVQNWLLNTASVYNAVRDSNVNGKQVTVIKVNLPEEVREEFRTIKKEMVFVFEKTSLLPVSVSEYKLILFQNEVLHQYKSYNYNHIETNRQQQARIFDLPEQNTQPAYWPEPLKQGEPAPEFREITLTGQTIDLKKLSGTPVIICFWKYDNYNCMQALSVVSGLQKTHRIKQLKAIGINLIDTAQTNDVKDALRKNNIEFDNVLTNNMRLLNDYHISSYPTIYVIDRSGKVAVCVEGYSRYLRTTLDRVIKGL